MKTLIAIALVAAGLLAATARAASPAPAGPTVIAVQPAPGTVGALSQITVMFNEAVTNVVATDLLANGNPAAEVNGSGATYTFTLERQPPYGVVQITWDPSQDIVDLEDPSHRFDENAPGSIWQYNLVDGAPPVVASLTPAEGVSLRTLTQIEVTFSEPVAGVEAADLLINGTPATGYAVLGAGKYRFAFPQPAEGTVQMAWAANHGIYDFAPTPNTFAGGMWSYTLDPNLDLPSIRINEFIAANVTGLADENGEAQDWIEIWNFGGSAVNLTGFSLSDDRDDPGRWTFPSTNLAPGQFLVVFASGKDRRTVTVATNQFHTSFKLGADGDYLGLFNAESPRVAITEFADYPEQRNDNSYGYDTGDTLKYFASPTPGAPNGTSAIKSIVPPPHFNVERGYFEAPFTLILSSPLYGSTMRYTTDGSEPTLGNGATYFAPLMISNTTVLRAAAFKTNVLPSLTITHTYLFLDRVLRQPSNPAGYPVGAAVWGGYPADYEMDSEIVTNAVYGPQVKAALKSLPSLSIVTSVDALFGPTNGIYTHVAESATQFRGVQWERACSVEFLPTNGSTGFQVNCGVRMQGNASRNPQKTPKHPMRLLFKGDYGPGRLEAEVFPDSPVQSFNTLVLRADFNNSWLHWDPNQRLRGTRIRDGWTKDTWRDMGQPGSHTRYVHLYINGLYWGIYDFGERVDATFAANYLGGEPEEYDAIASKPVEATDGDLIAYNAMTAAVRNRDQRILTNYLAVLDLLDVPNFADYMLLNFYGGNQDWGNDSNWNAIRRRTPGGKFKYISWDGEQLIVNVNDNRVSNTDVPGGLHTSLINSPEYRLTFGDRAHKHLFNGGALATNTVVQRWLNRSAQVSLATVAESARWGDYRRDVHQYQNPPYLFYTRNDHWQAEVNRLVNSYFPSRGDILLGQLRAAGLYPSVSAPVFNQHGGFVARGFNLTMAATNTIYVTTDGSDPRVFGSGEVSSNAVAYSAPLSLLGSTLVKARTLSGTNWSALSEATFSVDALGSPLRITEIMYNPLGGDAYEFLELQNVGATTLNVGSYSIAGINYVFPPNSLLNPGQIIVLGSDASPGNWTARYPGVPVFGRFGGRLDNGGEKLAINDSAGNTLWSADYDDANGWPASADGAGASLEIIDAFGDPDNPANWRTSVAANGTPGRNFSPAAASAVVLNEVMAENTFAVNNGGTYPDWIELHNASPADVNLGGWSLSDDSNPRKFVFPANTTIAAAGYLVVWCDTNALAPGLHTLFALGRTGDSIFLHDTNGSRVDAIGFGLQLPDHSIGRIINAWALTQPTPNAANVAAALASPTNLVINEWLADAPPGGDDWVELHNRSTNAPVSLRGIYLGTSNATFQLTALSFLAPGGFVQLLADENPGAGHLDFRLPAAGGVIALSDETGVELNQVTYGPQPQGVTQGRLPDGTVTVLSFPSSPSPAAANYLLSYSGPILNEVLARNRAAATNAARRTADYVELWNSNAAPFDLSGMRLSTDPNQPAQWIFPAGTSLAAGGYLVVWFDENEPPATATGAFLNTGHSINGESGEVWLFNSAGQPADSVVFGFQVDDRPIGRTADGSWTLLSSASPWAANPAPVTLGSASTLRFNEWLADSPDGSDWFEIYNTSAQPVELSGLFVTDNPSAPTLNQFTLPSLSFIGANGFVKCVADGHPSEGRDHVNFSLDGEGETLRLAHAALGVIDTIYFGLQPVGVSQGRLPDGSTNIVNFPDSPTPAESNYLPIPNAVINEVLTHAHLPFEDAIEIYNPTGTPADIGGWYLSDSQDDFRKFRIPPGTIVPAAGFKVFFENQFNGGAGTLVPLVLNSSRGDELWLSAVDSGGRLTGHRAGVRFGPAANGVSFGRFDTSIGTVFTAMSRRTFGAHDPPTVAQFRLATGRPNALPKVGPVVVNEIMYHPSDLAGTDDNDAAEFVELYNVTTSPVSLYDASATSNTWRLRGGVSFKFPPGVTLGSRSHLVIVSFDPAADPAGLALFRSTYSLPASVPIFGPYLGKFDNAGENIRLYQPDPPQGSGPDQGLVPYVLVDEVNYADVFPWPIDPDGGGTSLQRRQPDLYGNDPVNWKSGAATPGRANVAGAGYADSDGDGIADSWEIANGLDANNPYDANSDTDYDGPPNYGEFLDGVNPQSAASRLQAPVITAGPQSQTALPGSNVVFGVVASGTAPFSHQWHHDGKPMIGATAATLALSEVDKPNGGSYEVVVWNSAGFVRSPAATLTINIPPNILLHPASQVVPTNATVTFTVAAAGAGTIRYQWQFNGVDISGAISDTLVVPNVNLGNEGDYRALVTDDIATVPSATARLTVMVPPTILVPPLSQTNVVGANLAFTVMCSGSVPMGFIWRQGAIARSNVVLHTTNSTFTLNNAQLANSGAWRVIITNAGSPMLSSNATFTVLIVAPPVITNQPVSQTVSAGTNVTFSVGVTGTAPFRYQWHLEGSPLAGQTNAALTLTNVQPADRGNYHVVVANAGASVTSAVAVLNVAELAGLGGFTVLDGLRVMSNGQVRMMLYGDPSRRYLIEMSTNLNYWSPLDTIHGSNGPLPYIDATAVGVTNRFYRARLLP